MPLKTWQQQPDILKRWRLLKGYAAALIWIIRGVFIVIILTMVFSASESIFKGTSINVEGGMDAYRAQAEVINLRERGVVQDGTRFCNVDDKGYRVNSSQEGCGVSSLGFYYLSSEVPANSLESKPDRIQMYLPYRKGG